MINTYHSALEFDWWDRGQDFNRDMWGGRMSLRGIWVRIKHLPPGSALSRLVDPDQWRLEHHMIADLYDLTAIAGGVTTSETSKTPVTYERPSDQRARVVKEQERDRKIRESRDRLKKQLVVGGDVDG